MLLKVDDITFNVEQTYKNETKPQLILLHGFSGSSDDWKEITPKVITSVYTIDLPGHGKSSSPENSLLYSSENLIRSLDNITTQLNLQNFYLAGYSMGGRAALSYTIANPKKVRGLILESSSPGIENSYDREKRKKDDTLLVNLIEEKGIEFFVDYWMNLPIFKSQKNLPKEKLDNIQSKKLNSNPLGLANSLRAFGTGIMPSYWKRLSEISSNVLLITGSLDSKFTQIAESMKSLIPKCYHKIIDDCGHNTHLEKPDIFIDLLNNFLMAH